MKTITRDSNMELLRIIAMLLVLIVHADFMALGFPLLEDLQNAPITTFSRIYIGALSSVCVNVFVLISGWYGIKLKFKSLFKLIFQTSFFCILMFVCFAANKDLNLILYECANILLLRNYWFVRAYILLCLMAPMMNAFVEHASQKDFRHLLILYFVFQTIFSYMGNDIWYHDGYSPLTFFGLYLLARYLRVYPSHLSSLQKKWDMMLFLLTCLLISVISIILLYYDLGGGRMYNYTSPLLIIASIYLFLYFTKFELNSKAINWIAKSCFAAYLLHMNPYFVQRWFTELIHHWWLTEPTGLFLLFTTLYILALFAIAILIDKIQIALFERINKLIASPNLNPNTPNLNDNL